MAGWDLATVSVVHHSAPGVALTIIGGVTILIAGLSMVVSVDSPLGKVLTSFVTRQGQYSRSPLRLGIFAAIGVALLICGIVLLAAAG